MEIKTEVVGKIDNNHVQVKVAAKNYKPIYYKVPELEADSFQSEYKKHGKKAYWQSSIFPAIGLAITMSPAYYFTRSIQNKALRMGINIVSGIAGGMLGLKASSSMAKKSYTNLLKKHNAEELN